MTNFCILCLSVACIANTISCFMLLNLFKKK